MVLNHLSLLLNFTAIMFKMFNPVCDFFSVFNISIIEKVMNVVYYSAILNLIKPNPAEAV